MTLAIIFNTLVSAFIIFFVAFDDHKDERLVAFKITFVGMSIYLITTLVFFAIKEPSAEDYVRGKVDMIIETSVNSAGEVIKCDTTYIFKK